MAKANNNSPITFHVPGQRGEPGATRDAATGAAGAGQLPGKVKAGSSVVVGSQRDAGDLVPVVAVPGEDIVALHIEGGPVLLLHPHTARDLLQGPNRERGAAGATHVQVQAEMHWPGLGADAGATSASRGLLSGLGSVVMSAFQVLTGLGAGPLVKLATGQILQRVDGQVDAGVYPLHAQCLDKLRGQVKKIAKDALPVSAGPTLVLIHGTFVETTSTFHKLWESHADDVKRLFANYGDAVYALDHPTLGASPIANARSLVDALPSGAVLHLLTHSRGGLVAEVLARVAGQQGVVDADLAFFADAAYASQRQELLALGQLVKAKRISVSRVVRVACPAHGTLLASGRLDAYISVLKWMLEATGLPVMPELVEFAGEVARRRASPADFPGLAAMMPGAPLLRWLNAAPAPVPGDLRVLSGDMQAGSTLGSWIKALLADAYYWTDNDLIVQTRSMYGGAPRQGGASFLLDRGAGVSHFNYFANNLTATAAVDALVQAEAPAAFKTIGPLSWAGEEASGARGAPAVTPRPDASKPAVFVLPGIAGSNLKTGPADDAERIWPSWRLIGHLDRLAYQAGGADGITENGPVGAVYDKLCAHLSGSHEVIAFGYDWRQPLELEAVRLASAVNAALDARQASGQPVRLLAHSLGGLLARTMQIVAPAVWQRLMAHADARLVMLGVPHGGSWAPMQVLSGDDAFGNLLAALGSPFANRQARQVMAGMPGFLQLQAGLLADPRGLDKEASWRKLASDDFAFEQNKNWWHGTDDTTTAPVYQWGVPPQAVLDQAKALREKLDAQHANILKTDARKMAQVLGQATLTPIDFDIDNSEGFVYLNEQDQGDGRVPMASSLLPDVPTWTLNCSHGKLPCAEHAFDAFTELLTQGRTLLLPGLQTTRDGAAAAPAQARLQRNRPARQGNAGALGSMQDLLRAEPAAPADTPATQPALQITVMNGNLSFVSQPLLLGHYRSLALTGTEAVVDEHVGGAMRAALEAGLYADAPGTHRIFLNLRANSSNPWQLPKPSAAIVIGLGDEAELSTRELEMSVCQGAKAWAQRAREEAPLEVGPSDGIALTATLIGSGGLGINPSAAAQAIARGVWRANQGIEQANQCIARVKGITPPWPQIHKLTFVELYLDRATEAWRGLQVLALSDPAAYVLTSTIHIGTQPMRRQTDTGYRGANYDLISVGTEKDGALTFTLDTHRARNEVRAQRNQASLLRKLVEMAATSRSGDPRLGSTLFRLLVPPDLKPFLSGNDRLVLQLDKDTAPIPWELLDTRVAAGAGGPGRDELPWSIRTQLLRKLATKDFDNSRRDADAQAAVLIIGVPQINDDRYPPLPGALREATKVLNLFNGPGGLPASQVNAQLEKPFDKVVMALMAMPYRIIHVAGHGAPIKRDERTGELLSKGGVVLSDGVFLGPDEIDKLPAVPELVFVNCCHLGAFEQTPTLAAPPREAVREPVAFAAGMAEALIAVGVRCVVAAGWAVDDIPAAVFAEAFYKALLDKKPFIEAVTTARKAAWLAAPHSKTWAAYQCYGDPNWRLRTATADAQANSTRPGDDLAAVASAPDLALLLENLAVTTSAHTAKDDAAREIFLQDKRRQLTQLEQRFSATWADVGAVAEAFAVAWVAADDVARGIAWYEKALRSPDASASIKVQEQLGNHQVREAWRLARDSKASKAQRALSRRAMQAALQSLQALATAQPTAERWSLCGSAHKRLAQLDVLEGKGDASTRAFGQAAAAYAKAEALAAITDPSQAYYAGMNRMALELALNIGQAQWPGFDAPTSQRLRSSLQAACDTRPEFFNHSGLIEFAFYEAVARRNLADSLAVVQDGYANLYKRVATRREWQSVADQAAFVLTAYQTVATAKEKAAATALQKVLDGYAGRAEAVRRRQRPPATSTTAPVE